jgi:hypothetical protein
MGVGFGFANSAITNSAVSRLPPSRAGVAGAITSTARHFGGALGIALAGSIVAGATTTRIADASHLGWLLVSGCGFLVLARATTSPAATAVGAQ